VFRKGDAKKNQAERLPPDQRWVKAQPETGRAQIADGLPVTEATLSPA